MQYGSFSNITFVIKISGSYSDLKLVRSGLNEQRISQMADSLLHCGVCKYFFVSKKYFPLVF